MDINANELSILNLVSQLRLLQTSLFLRNLIACFCSFKSLKSSANAVILSQLMPHHLDLNSLLIDFISSIDFLYLSIVV
ncbi:MAG: hypothetical protein WCG25_07370 [bacterium]